MENSVEHDPQQYSEEWFNVAVLLGKEFELPNISNPPLVNKTSMTLSKKQPSCNNDVPKYTFDLNESIEPTYDDQTDVWTTSSVPSKKARFEPNHESNSVQGREILVDLNKTAPECDTEGDEYKCFMCNASFTSKNALYGHKGSHAKQKKKTAIMCGNVFKPGSFSGFGESRGNFFSDDSDMFVVENTGIEVVDEEKSAHSDSKEH